MDIKIRKSGDIIVTENGDIELTGSLQQAILIHLRWIYAEWRLGNTLGFPWFEDVFVKNPNIEKIKKDVRDTINEINGIKYSTVDRVEYSAGGRTAHFYYTAVTDEETFSGEVTLDA